MEKRERDRINDEVRAMSARELTCGGGTLCTWMKDATDGPLCGLNTNRDRHFEAREMQHPDTLEVVKRVVVTSPKGERIVRACPVCGGNPNERQVVRGDDGRQG